MVSRREPNRSVARREPLRKGEEDDDINLLADRAPATPSKRKRTIEDDDEVLLTPPSSTKKPRKRHLEDENTLLTPPSTPSSVYSVAKALFQRGSGESGVIGREAERQALRDFFVPLIKQRSHGALYLSGTPGTGKSALLAEVLGQVSNELASRDCPIRVANLNCMVVDRPHLIFARIYRHLARGGPPVARGELDMSSDDDEEEESTVSSSSKTIQSLERLLLNPKNRTRHVVVLDELDHVVTRDQEVLFRIFHWAFARSSNLILVGIANALDLTDRFLPRLRANSLTPQTLAFGPYSAAEIAHIIETRLRSLNNSSHDENDDNDNDNASIPLMHPAAIQLCARKTAANTGDLRKAFDICRRAIELVEEEVRKSRASESDSGNWKQALVSGHSPTTSLTLHEAPKVTVMNISKICTLAFGSSSVTRVRGLNLQQKAVLSVLVVHEAGPTPITVMRLFELYTQTCMRDRMLARLQLTEFYDVISALESAGVVNVSGVCGRKGMGSARGRSSRGGTGAGAAKPAARDDYSQRKIAPNVHKMDLMTGIDDVPLLKQILRC
ncbi:hypothetical protein TRICI_006080 [Trichomonascus ciferrii]|uniref:Cell division control protein n=1 Tax=Trichomonascus ciferrii TaxID=44093 RepID=A0A642ULG2_9ASCO|nr:hypothetical protein TRICI_006080 [Trichomonascus ciferrii]